MTLDAYLHQTSVFIANRLDAWAAVRNPGQLGILAGAAVGVLALWLGTIAATRLLAQVSANTAFWLAVTWVVLVFVEDAGCKIYAATPAVQGAAAFATLGLMLFAATRALNTSWPRAGGVLALSCFFGGLAGTLLALMVRLLNAI